MSVKGMNIAKKFWYFWAAMKSKNMEPIQSSCQLNVG